MQKTNTRPNPNKICNFITKLFSGIIVVFLSETSKIGIDRYKIEGRWIFFDWHMAFGRFKEED